MKILFILEKRSPSGFDGVTMNFFYRCKGLEKKKIDYLGLYNSKDKMYKFCLKKNVNIRYLPFPGKSPKNILHKKFEILKFRKIIKGIIDENNITHVHVHNGYILDFLEKKWNVIITAHHHSAFTDNKPIKYFYPKLLANPKLLINKFYEKLIVFNYEKAKKIIAVSKASKKTLSTKYGIQNKKIEVIYNGIDNIRNSNENLKSIIKNKFKIKNTDKIILSVGRITKSKGVEDFCEVAKSFKDKENIKFIFVGAYRSKDYYNYIKKKYKNYVIFPGEISDVTSFYKISDIFLFLSHRESFGNVLVESMYFKIPSIVWNITALSEVVINNYNGYCCPFSEIDFVKKKLNHLINNKKEYQRISQNAFNRKDKFTIENNVNKFINFLSKIRL